jgi:hypothetical protein
VQRFGGFESAVITTSNGFRRLRVAERAAAVVQRHGGLQTLSSLLLDWRTAALEQVHGFCCIGP